MPLPDALRRHLGDPDFWSAYRFESYQEWPELEELTVEFPVAPGHRLTLGLGGLGYLSLGLARPGAAEPVEVGWDDQAHWHPNVLRWDELDLFARCLALADPTLPHPGPVVLLLNRFTPICSADDADRAFPLLETAWRATLGVSGSPLDDLVEKYDRRHTGFTWIRSDPHGWVLEHPEADQQRSGWTLYTLRTADNEEFPFAGWNDLVSASEAMYRARAAGLLAGVGDTVGRLASVAAEEADLTAAAALADALEEAGREPPDGVLDALRSGDPCRAGWVLEWLAGEPRGSVITRLCGPARPATVWHSFEIEWPEALSEARPSMSAGLGVATRLNDSLKADRLGGANVSGSVSATRDGQEVSRRTWISVTVRDDEAAGVERIRSVLIASSPPAGTVFRQVRPLRREIPLHPGEPTP